MTEPFDAVLAEMRNASILFQITHERARKWADRLSAAHAAEVGERDAIADGYRVSRNAYEQDVVQLQARAEAAERDARELRVDIAKAYAMIPSLPVAPETCDAATDALHYIGLMMGLHAIDAAIATTEQADD